MRFPDGFVEDLRATANVVAVIGSYVTLKKAGQSYKGLCPFHHEKTPSFNVNEGRGVFYCFGCQEGGDVFHFVMRFDKVGFHEAVRKVAELSGVPLPKEEWRPGDDRRERIYAVNERALQVFRETLASTGGAAARAYLEKRGVGKETVETFELGLAPEGWEGLSQALLRAGFSAAELLASGLAKERPQRPGIYDRFHERLIFPIRNPAGRLIGFGGRILGPGEPKYLNSPETEVYSKGEVLYGLGLARDAVRQAGEIVLVEGYLDLISLHQAGIAEVVASCGTALTSAQARLLARHAKRILVAYDGDAAGRAAARKALRVLVPERLAVGVVELEAGQDPDDFVRAAGADAFRARMRQACGFVEFLVAQARGGDGGGTATPEARLRLVNEVLPVLALVGDPLERALQAAKLAEASGLGESVLLEAVRKAAAERKDQVEAVPAVAASAAWSEAEAVLARALVSGPEAVAELAAGLDPEDWRGLPSGPVLDRIAAEIGAGRAPSASGLLGLLGDGDRERAGRALVAGAASGTREAREALKALRAARLRRELGQVQAAIPRAAEGDLDRLLERKQELSRELDGLASPGGWPGS